MESGKVDRMKEVKKIEGQAHRSSESVSKQQNVDKNKTKSATKLSNVDADKIQSSDLASSKQKLSKNDSQKDQ